MRSSWNSSGSYNLATKRQKLESGYLRKVHAVSYCFLIISCYDVLESAMNYKAILKQKGRNSEFSVHFQFNVPSALIPSIGLIFFSLRIPSID